jgi:hypothetical protein
VTYLNPCAHRESSIGVDYGVIAGVHHGGECVADK